MAARSWPADTRHNTCQMYRLFSTSSYRCPRTALVLQFWALSSDMTGIYGAGPNFPEPFRSRIFLSTVKMGCSIVLQLQNKGWLVLRPSGEQHRPSTVLLHATKPLWRGPGSSLRHEGAAAPCQCTVGGGGGCQRG
jgi:hypothetical protein